MAYGVARAAGGDLRIDSEPGEGATVTLFLPRSSLAETMEPAAARQQRSPSSGRKVRMLLVDDDPEVRQAIADMLRRDGHEVIEAENGYQALQQLEQAEPQVALLDFAMPGMNGAELAARLLQLRPGLKLLFLTGYADSNAIDQAVRDGAPILKKPVTAADLLAAIDDLLG